MSNDTYTVEHHMKVHDDKTGDYIKIGPDPDGLNLCEIEMMGKNGTSDGRLVIPWPLARIMAQAVLGVEPLKEHPRNETNS